ncbi:hypothetical protein Nepgr_019678 [Nepenthes gracilis]|uniref:Uncharacterized protein n=1 Tax=Nepenthes gracilis TaxID=150966 RepID=A0AAD3SWH6_NEPGR|nr:hypothetical protein Nepgr_019678 [Nepenthes gracilis]
MRQFRWKCASGAWKLHKVGMFLASALSNLLAFILPLQIVGVDSCSGGSGSGREEGVAKRVYNMVKASEVQAWILPLEMLVRRLPCACSVSLIDDGGCSTATAVEVVMGCDIGGTAQSMKYLILLTCFFFCSFLAAGVQIEWNSIASCQKQFRNFTAHFHPCSCMKSEDQR